MKLCIYVLNIITFPEDLQIFNFDIVDSAYLFMPESLKWRSVNRLPLSGKQEQTHHGCTAAETAEGIFWLRIICNVFFLFVISHSCQTSLGFIVGCKPTFGLRTTTMRKNEQKSSPTKLHHFKRMINKNCFIAVLWNILLSNCLIKTPHVGDFLAIHGSLCWNVFPIGIIFNSQFHFAQFKW